jgi:hypothetical protein
LNETIPADKSPSDRNVRGFLINSCLNIKKSITYIKFQSLKKLLFILKISGIILFYITLIGAIIWQIATSWQTAKYWVIGIPLLIIFIVGIYTIIKTVSHWPLIEDFVDYVKYNEAPQWAIIILVFTILVLLLIFL